MEERIFLEKHVIFLTDTNQFQDAIFSLLLFLCSLLVPYASTDEREEMQDFHRHGLDDLPSLKHMRIDLSVNLTALRRDSRAFLAGERSATRRGGGILTIFIGKKGAPEKLPLMDRAYRQLRHVLHLLI